MTIECSQSVYSIVHDNKMLAERAFYCMTDTINTGIKWENGEADT